ncbi:hypothetical protein [Kordia sp.]|uniref:hypothetical protein n=1 Tax=Kordia sp. TaxID=1965332 RepID=UPI003B595685
MKKYIAYLLMAFMLFNCSDDDAPVNLAEVEILSVSEFVNNSIPVTSRIISQGEDAIQERGICWSTSANPTTSDNTAIDESAQPQYIVNASNLEVNTTYYIRAYAINSAGTSYSEQEEVSTHLPEVITVNITNITSNSIAIVGEVVNQGSTVVTERGISWSTTPNPTIEGSYMAEGNGEGAYIVNIDDLEQNQIYYIRAYAINSIGISYGNEIEFNSNLPVVNTTAITNISDVLVESGGEVIDEGGTAVIAKGICWSTTPNPTIDNSITNDGAGIGEYTSNITGVTVNTNYYVRAYATNSSGTMYGNEIEFNTNLPEVNTAAITNITGISAESGGEVTNEGGASVTAKGICWSTTPNPTITDNATNDGDGIGTFTSTLTGLIENETYYVRAYATNNIGTAYSDEVEFVSNACSSANITAEAIILSTQQEVDDFNYSSVGSLIIENTSSITDLSPLSCLTSIEVYLRIINNSNLTSLTGLENLQEIGWGITIENNPVLTSINLENVVSITNNVSFVYIEDFPMTLSIKNNTNLITVSMPSLSGGLGDAEIEDCVNLTTIELPLTGGGLGFDLRNLPSLVNLNIDNLTNIGAATINGNAIGGMSISNTGLVNLDAFVSFERSSRYFSITNNQQLQNIDGLSNALIRTEGLNVSGNPLLTNLNGLASATTLNESSLGISNNASLTNIDGVSNFLGGSLYTVYISNNDSLANVDVMSALGGCTYGGVTVENNNVLTDLCGLTNYANALINNNDMYGPCILNLSGNAYNPSPQDIVDGNCSQ